MFVQRLVILEPFCFSFFRYKFNKAQLRQVFGVFDPENNGNVNSSEFLQFCECGDVAEAVQLALEVQAEAAKNAKYSDHQLLVCAKT